MQIVGHGYDNNQRQATMARDAEDAMIGRCVATIRAEEGDGSPKGWLSPAFSESEHTVELLLVSPTIMCNSW